MRQSCSVYVGLNAVITCILAVLSIRVLVTHCAYHNYARLLYIFSRCVF